MPAPPKSWSSAEVLSVVERVWGFRSLRPLQEQAIQAVLDGRDSLVVLPTGGGKSLCYQAPAVLRGDTAVVVSPLISLMKDQVDALQACGVPAAPLNSSQSFDERQIVEREARQGQYRLLFVAPERLVLDNFQRLLRQLRVVRFTIDEAHCISHWGHDFRPEYRQISQLRESFPDASFHAFTATATQQVRDDIVHQLGLREPAVLVGDFDRPNLTYRVLPRKKALQQVLDILKRHTNEAGIVYCIRRREVDELCVQLKELGHDPMPYHAGMSPEDRKATQDAFTDERCNLVVATVAFGMGIDRSNIRFVIHTGMPKSIEHYQQEAGRAGRDGEPSECVLLASGGDIITWKSVIEKSAQEAGVEDAAFLSNAFAHLEDMYGYARGGACRHKVLVEYFDQPFAKTTCGACDICLREVDYEPESTVIAQKILSCVARVKENFGAGHVVAVLTGDANERVAKWNHTTLSTFGILSDRKKNELNDWIQQLLAQGLLDRVGEYHLLKLNPTSWEVMHGKRQVRLQKAQRKASRTQAALPFHSSSEAEVFESLRGLRTVIAREIRKPPYVIFTDATLRELAKVKPTTPDQLRQVAGVGDAKLRAFGDRFLELLRQIAAPPPVAANNGASYGAFDLFRAGRSIDEVMKQTGRARGTVAEYLCDFIRVTRPESVATWVPEGVYQQVAAVARRFGAERLGPLHAALGEKVDYDTIRVVVTHMGLK